MGRAKLTTTKRNSDKFATLNMRIPKEVADKLKDCSQENGKTVTALVTDILEGYFSGKDYIREQVAKQEQQEEVRELEIKRHEEVNSHFQAVQNKLDTIIALIAKL